MEILEPEREGMAVLEPWLQGVLGAKQSLRILIPKVICVAKFHSANTGGDNVET